MPSRPASAADLDHVLETITLAFEHDPVWGVALARPDGSTAHHEAFWRPFIEHALGAGSVSMTDDGGAVSVWVLPGGAELSDDAAGALLTALDGWLGPTGARAMVELWARFEANHPHDAPHAYLSLLATHPDHRGRGVGQQLLAEDLARFDASGLPCYLESTNPGNDHRYERAGFRRVGGFETVIDGAPVATMWRAVAMVGEGGLEPPTSEV